MRRAARPACPCLLQPAVWAVPCLQHRQRSALLEPRYLILPQPGPPHAHLAGIGFTPAVPAGFIDDPVFMMLMETSKRVRADGVAML